MVLVDSDSGICRGYCLFKFCVYITPSDNPESTGGVLSCPQRSVARL
jgi:hypothetical protein